MTIGLLVGVAVGLCAGIAIGLLLRSRHNESAMAEARLAQGRLADAQSVLGRLGMQCEQATTALSQLQADNARLCAELSQAHRSADDRAQAWEEDRDRLVGTFAQLSSEALRSNTEQFLTLADSRLKEAQEAARGDLGQRQEAITQLLDPLKDLLGRYESGLRQMELERKGAYSGLTEQVKQLASSQDQLKKETHNLVTALRAPQTRGRWGEMQLRRVVEMAGMLAHCDFDEQVTTTNEDGRLRPDLVVHLPGGAHVVVDAKVPLDAFLRAIDAGDEPTRQAALVAHARQLRTHIDQLSKREYWKQFDPSPDLVVAFVPGDSLFTAACEQDGELIEYAVTKQVLIATPTTLIGLLRMFAQGWRDEAMAENARLVKDLGTELYDRLRVLGGHFAKMHRSLTSTVEAFNEAVGSLESRVLVTARRFPDLSVVGHDAKEVAELRPVTSTPRLPQAAELTEPLAGLEGLPPGRPQLDIVAGGAEEAELPGISDIG
ncbi:MAG: DNA recombination protein RmuC [Acidimicrobiales bacterium]